MIHVKGGGSRHNFHLVKAKVGYCRSLSTSYTVISSVNLLFIPQCLMLPVYFCSDVVAVNTAWHTSMLVGSNPGIQVSKTKCQMVKVHGSGVRRNANIMVQWSKTTQLLYSSRHDSLSSYQHELTALSAHPHVRYDQRFKKISRQILLIGEARRFNCCMILKV